MSDFSPPDVTARTERQMAHRPDARAGGAGTRQADALGFWDLVDVVNPLQHIPVVSTVYRKITGDEIRPEARIFGATLYGGPLGLALSAANAIIEESTGRTVEEHALALFDDAPGEAPAVYAEARPAASGITTGEDGSDETARIASADGQTEPAVVQPDADAPAASDPLPERTTAVLPNGFPLTPQSRTGVRILPPSRPAELSLVDHEARLTGTDARPVAIGTGLDAALTRLAAESATMTAAESVGKAPQAEPADATGARPVHPFAVPDGEVADAMMRALDLYRKSTTSATAAPSSLDTRS